MTFVRVWLRVELPRRWRSLAVLALLIAVAGATVMAAVAGARRGASAPERLAERTHESTVAVYSNTPNFDWGGVRRLPEVAALTTFLIDYSYAFEGYPSTVGGFPPADDEMLRSIETPVVYQGRMFVATHADEVVVTRRFASHWHKRVGDHLMLDLPTPPELAAGSGSGPNGSYTGPHLRMTIVGVVASIWFSDEPGAHGFVLMSPGVVAKYPDNTLGPTNDPRNLFNYVSALVRLRGGEADIARFQTDLARLSGRADLEVVSQPTQVRLVQHQLTFEARCVLAFGAAAFLAAFLLIGQAVARFSAASTTELRGMRAVGLTPRQAVVAAAAAPAIAGVVGALLGLAGAYLASDLFPLGTADLLEPAPGRSVDWTVFAPGALGIAVVVAIGSAAAAWFALASARRSATARRSSIATAAARAGLALPVVIGARFALEAGRGRAAVPVRPALLGAIGGVAGILAAFTFSSGVSDAVSHPERFGQTISLTGYVGQSDHDYLPAAKVLTAVAKNRAVLATNDARQSIATDSAGGGTYVLYSYTAGRTSVPVVLTSGRMISAPDEVVLAPRTLSALHARVGGHVTLAGKKSSATFLVTGVALVPEGPRNSYAEGGWLTPGGYDEIFSGFKFHLLQVVLRPGADVIATNTALTAAIAAAVPEASGFSLSPPDPPIEIAELRQVRVLPVVLGLFLALLAAGAVGHALATAVRRRSHDVAVLRALGMTQRQSRWVVVTQASLLAVIGLLAGIPLGLAAGRVVWRAVAHATPIQYVPPWATVALLLAAPAALLLANILALFPARRAARLRIADMLRTE